MEEVKKQGMKSLFCPYEQALELKQLRFDEPCIKEFHKQNLLSNSTGEEITNTQLIELYGEQDVISAPTFSQAFRFFREKYQASPTIHCMSEQGNSWKYHIPNEGGERDFNTYEEAELACLIKLIDIVKLSGL